VITTKEIEIAEGNNDRTQERQKEVVRRETDGINDRMKH
jgi:hypothetical protein